MEIKGKKKDDKKTNIFSAEEEAVLDFWDKAKTFEKSVLRPGSGGQADTKDAPKGDYVFYDGPPFGTGEPHYGHLLSSISKDVVPRYWTMRGYRVERRWGWDCHGLPIENIIERDLKISGKKEIEELGIDKFNEACRYRVLEYADIWDTMVRRIGRWVDFKNSYKTMDKNYMESVWWAFGELWKKDLVYEGRKVLLYCPRCETPISNFEVAMDNSYKDITETSVYVKFKLKKNNAKIKINDNTYILAWTTTPWTLPGNVALAVGESIKYQVLNIKGSDVYYILAKDRVGDVMKDENYTVIEDITGKDLVGLEYEPLFDAPGVLASGKKAYYVAAADFVTTEDGTGVVHTAVVYGEDDYNLGVAIDLPVVPMLDNKGIFNESVPQFKGVYFKQANKLVISDLEKRGLLYRKEDIEHSYPHCHRCDTQLFYNAIPAWFISIEKLRKKLLEENEKINWYPEHLKHGRFKLGIEQAPDWNISRNRYFATPMPIWKCSKCGNIEIISSVKELEEKSKKTGITDIHSHFIDDLGWQCSKCSGEMRRISEVFDCWVESGSMSFAQYHYPFENKEKFEKTFPAQFISEYISQTRAWFYVMHVMSTALFNSNSFENVVTTGVILNEKGEKMSKSKKNFPDPGKVIDDFGADALRFYLMSSSLMHAENLFFNEREMRDVFRKNIMLVWNVFKFYGMYAGEVKVESKKTKEESKNILDQWILARLDQLIKEVTENMDHYDLPRATRPITDFIDDLSTWYIRRSRNRFKSGDLEDKNSALQTTAYVLLQLSKIMAPFMPFIAERIWQKVTGYNFKDENKSVHLEAWPIKLRMANDELRILDEMAAVRKIIELGLAERDKAGIKVRQPLRKFSIFNFYPSNEHKQFSIKNYENLIKDELNVKEVALIDEKGEMKVELDTKITEELKDEGMKRELTRAINNLRKQSGLTIQDKAAIYWESDESEIKNVFEKFKSEILSDTLSVAIDQGNTEESDNKKELTINGLNLSLGIIKK